MSKSSTSLMSKLLPSLMSKLSPSLMSSLPSSLSSAYLCSQRNSGRVRSRRGHRHHPFYHHHFVIHLSISIGTT